MDADYAVAKNRLKTGSDTLAVCLDGRLYTDTESGIKPLLKLIDSDLDLRGACAADRIVGKAAAMLYVILGVSRVYAETLGKSGQAVFERYGISYEYDTLTDHIINRAGTDLCPMELAVRDIDDPEAALSAVKQKSRELQIQNAYIQMCDAMIEKDKNVLKDVLDDRFVLIHMTGMRQNKEAFITAVLDGTLNYYSAVHDSMTVTVNADTAVLTGQTRVEAAVFGGAKRHWRLQQKCRLKYTDGRWKIIESTASIY